MAATVCLCCEWEADLAPASTALAMTDVGPVAASLVDVDPAPTALVTADEGPVPTELVTADVAAAPCAERSRMLARIDRLAPRAVQVGNSREEALLAAEVVPVAVPQVGVVPVVVPEAKVVSVARGVAVTEPGPLTTLAISIEEADEVLP